MGLAVAFKAFFAALASSETSERLARALAPEKESARALDVAQPSNASSTREPRGGENGTSRSSALDLLAALQRDARFLDFVQEDLSQCDDATVGAVARGVRNGCAATLERFFAVRPLVDAPEGETATFDAATARNGARVRVSRGAIASSTDPVVGRVVHAGWQATKYAPPVWSGDEADAFVLAPVELEVD